MDNIKYGNREATKKMVIKASIEADAHHFINKFPNKYDTKLIEGGSNLSGGERQRIMLARAFLTQNNFIILDEATSSLDIETEGKVIDIIKNKLKKTRMTIIVIAHSVSTIKNADHIIILDRAKIIDQGKLSDLSYDDSWYSKMLEIK